MPRTRNCASSSSSGLSGNVDEEAYKEIFGEYEHTNYSGSSGSSGNLLESSWAVADGFQPGTNKGNAQFLGSSKLSGPTNDDCDNGSTNELHRVMKPKKNLAHLTRRKVSKPNPSDVWMGYLSPPRKADDGFSSGSADSRSSSDDCETASHTGTSSDPFSLPSPDQCLTPGASDEDEKIFLKGRFDVHDPDDIIQQICGDYSTHGCSNPVECLRDLTPGLFASPSSSRTSHTSKKVPSSPEDDDDTIVRPSPEQMLTSFENTGDERLRGRPGEVSSASGNVSSVHIGSRKRKRPMNVDEGKDEHEPEHGEDQSTMESGNVTQESVLLPIVGLSKLYDVEFLLHRFGFTSAFDAAQTWPCPFPSIGPNCQETFTSKQLQKHIRAHWKDYEKSYPGKALQCPWKECNSQGKSKKQVVQIGPNESLARHILDKHLKGRGVQCVCGSPVGRAVKDQVVRHLLASSHQEKLATRRVKDPNFPEYPSIRDPILLEEQQAWKSGAGGDDADDSVDNEADDEDERGEGSSTAHKRARRF